MARRASVRGAATLAWLAWAGCGGGAGGAVDRSDLGAPIDGGASEDAGARIAEATIGPAGGELRSGDGRVTLTIPAGALDAERTLTIERSDTVDADVVGASYAIEPSGVVFAVAATLRVDASAVELGGAAPESVALSTRTPAGWEMVSPQARNARADGGVTVAGLLGHLSEYAATFVHHAPRGACAECAAVDWDACCAAGTCTTDGAPSGLPALVQGECRMSVAPERMDQYFPTIESFQVCYGLERAHPIGPCSACQVECALASSRAGIGPTTVLGWRTIEAGTWSTGEVCTMMRFLDPTSDAETSTSEVLRCWQACAERGEGDRACGPDGGDAGPPPDPTDAGSPPDPTDAGPPPDPTDAGPPPDPTDAGAPDAGPCGLPGQRCCGGGAERGTCETGCCVSGTCQLGSSPEACGLCCQRCTADQPTCAPFPMSPDQMGCLCDPRDGSRGTCGPGQFCRWTGSCTTCNSTTCLGCCTDDGECLEPFSWSDTLCGPEPFPRSACYNCADFMQVCRADPVTGFPTCVTP